MQNMKQSQKRLFSMIASLLMIFSLLAPGLAVAESAQLPPIEKHYNSKPDAKNKMAKTLIEAFKEEDQVTFLIKFKEKADVKTAKEKAVKKAEKANLSNYQTKNIRNSAVLSTLKETAFEEQQSVGEYLDTAVKAGLAKDVRSFYVVNGMAVTATKAVAEEIAAFEEVEFVTKNETRQLIEGKVDEAIQAVGEVEWSVDRIDAPSAWSDGIDGTGTVVASIDTGAQWDHPALKEKYYGYDAVTGEVDHSESWFDATAGKKEAYDDQGHGTHTIGTMVGGESDGSNKVGVAPGAKFIAAKAFTASGGGADVDITAAGEWVAEQADIVDVVTNSWSGGPGIDEWYMDIVDTWIELGIFPEFSAGNVTAANPGGPGSIATPANYPQSFATGNTDEKDMIASSSLRGPSPYGENKPDISAPGTSIRSSVPGGGYASMSGTSMAGPALSGVAAMLRQVNPDITVDEMKDVLIRTATPRTDEVYKEVPNNGYGHGIVNAYDAIASMQGGSGLLQGIVTGVDELWLDGQVSIKETGRSSAINPETGAYSIRHGVGKFTALAEAYGYASAEQTVDITKDDTTQLNIDLEILSTYEVSGRIINEDGNPVKDAKLHLVEDSRVKIDNTDEDGNFSFETFDGDYTLKVMANGYRIASVEFTINGDRVEQNIILEPLYTYPGGEIGYDDGSANSFSRYFNGGHGYAVRMSLPEGQDNAVVTGALFQFADDFLSSGTKFAVEVWDADENGNPKERIAGPVNAEAILEDEVWTQVDLKDDYIHVGGDFYMVYIQIDNRQYAPYLAFDNSRPNANRTYSYVNHVLAPAFSDGNAMIRAQVDYEVGTPQITSPNNGFITNESTIEVSGLASPTITVKVTNNNQTSEGQPNDEGEFSLDIDLTEGENTFNAETVFDGKVIRESTPITVILDIEAPELAIEFPRENEQHNQEVITVKGTVSDKYLDKVEVNGEKANIEDGIYSKQILLQEGSNDIEVVATDKAGNSTIKTIPVYVNLQSPVIQKIKPEADQYVMPGDEVEISFSSTTKGGEANFKVKFPTLSSMDSSTSSNMKEVEPGIYKGTWTAPANTNLEGAVIQVELTDAAGNKVTQEADGKLYISRDQLDRISGEDRYLTAIEVSQKGWAKSDTVVIARGNDFADALAGVPLAYQLNAPVLLTLSDKLYEETLNEIKRLGAKKVIILGGSSAISDSVTKELEKAGLKVERIAGANRFETASKIATKVAPDGATKVVVANGMDFPDALSVASHAAKAGHPILLTETNKLPKETQNAIKDLNASETIVVGGTTVVSAKVAKELPKATRLAGKDRYKTNIAIAKHFNVDSKQVYVATGKTYADALTGAVLAAKNDSTILLVHDRVPEVVTTYLTDQNVNRVTIFGGEAAVSSKVADDLKKLIE